MEFIAKMKDGKIIWSSEQRSIMDHHVHRWKDGTQVRIEIKRIQNPGTYQQLKMHFGLVVATIKREFEERGMDLACFLRSDTIPEGQPVPVDVIQAVLYAVAGDVGDNHERKRLSKMDSAERSRFFDRCRDYCAAQWHIQIPDPDPTWSLRKEAR